MYSGRRSVKAKDSKRMTSTASRINRHHVASLFWTLVAVDFVILLTILLTWAYMAEKAALGDAWAANMYRHAEWTEGLSFFDTLRSVVYRFSLPGGGAISIGSRQLFDHGSPRRAGLPGF